LSISLPARAAIARASGILIAVAIFAGLTSGGAYAIGAVARAAVSHARIERLARTAANGFSDQALEANTVDPGALAIAHRHDPYNASPPGTDRLASYAGALAARRPVADPRLRRIALLDASYASTTPARPFHLRGVLDESRDLECLTQAVYYEARGESGEGQAAVAQVVLNRTRHPAFPSTVCGVVFQGAGSSRCQFSFACDGSVGRPVDNRAWRRAEKVAARALDGFVMARVGAATHFHTVALSPAWGPKLLKVAQVGAHVFYRFSGRRGSASAFEDTPEPSAPAPVLVPAPPQTIHAVQPIQPGLPAAQPVYASLALTPLATTVADTVADAATAGAELVMAAAAPKAEAATAPKPANLKPAKAASGVKAAPAKPVAAPAVPASTAAKPAAEAAVKAATVAS